MKVLRSIERDAHRVEFPIYPRFRMRASGRGPSPGVAVCSANSDRKGGNLVVVGSSGDDAVTFAANQVTIGSGIVTTTGVPVQNLSFKGGAGNDSLTLNGGSYAFTTDVSLNTTHLSLSLQSGAQVSFSGIQHLAGLSLAGASAVTLADGGQIAIVVQSLSIDATSKLDLADDGLIVNYSGSDPFSSIYPLISASAHNGWAGVGLVSHSAAANSQHALGIADNASLGLLILRLIISGNTGPKAPVYRPPVGRPGDIGYLSVNSHLRWPERRQYQRSDLLYISRRCQLGWSGGRIGSGYCGKQLAEGWPCMEPGRLQL